MAHPAHDPTSGGTRLPALLVAAVLFASFAWFDPGRGSNQDTRLDLARALAFDHTVIIDPYHPNTIDKAYYAGHYYCDKAPGLSLAAVPVVFLAGSAMRLAGADPAADASVAALRWIATTFTVSLAAAMGGAILFLLLIRIGCTLAGAAVAALACGLATPMWSYSSLLWGHAFAAALLLAAFAAAVALDGDMGARRRSMLAAAVGLCAGYATLSEFPAAVPAVLIALLALYQSRRRHHAPFLTVLAVAAPALACAAVLLLYNWAAFGSPLRFGYSYNVAFPTMQEGLMGLTYPKLGVLRELLLGRGFGVLRLAPVLALALAGCFLPWRTPPAVKGCAAAIAAFYVLMNASYNVWDGGVTYGPRHLSPALPFLCLGLAPLWMRARRLRVAIAAAAALGTLATLGTVAFVLSPRNLGNLAGLRGGPSVAPLLGLWAAAAVIWMRAVAPARAGSATAAETGSSLYA